MEPVYDSSGRGDQTQLSTKANAAMAITSSFSAIRLAAIREWLCANLVLSLTVVALVLGVIIGSVVRLYDPDETTKILIGFPGEILMNMLKMMILPLIMSSLISGLAQLDTKSSGRIGTYSLIYYAVTTILAVILGIILVLAIHPGNLSIKQKLEQKQKPAPKYVESVDTFLDLIRNMFPENIVQATMQQSETVYVLDVEHVQTNVSGLNISKSLDPNGTSILNETRIIVKDRKIEYKRGMNVLGFIVFCIAFGIVVGQVGEQASLLVQFFVILDMVIMRLIMIVMWYSPFGIMSLIAGKIIVIESMKDTVASLAWYMATVILGLLIHALIILPGLFLIFVRRNPFIFMRNMFQAWITAVGTASSAATLPVTFRCLEEKNHVDKRVTRFVLPIGATINMDGTALYEAVAAIFIAQLNNRQFSFGEVVTVSLTATLASVGAASVPSAGLVTMLLVLTAVGLPTEDVTLIVTVDWILDRLRTSVNVLGDAFGAGIVDHLSKADLRAMDAASREKRESLDMTHNGPAGGGGGGGQKPEKFNDNNTFQSVTVHHRPSKGAIGGTKEERETLM